MKINQETLKLAEVLWDYHNLNQKVEKTDLILVLGSHDKRVAERASELYLQGFAPKILFSGGLGILTKGLWTVSEADQFAKVAIKAGVFKEDIYIENESTNTGENIKLSYDLISEKGLKANSILIVQKPYMERRAYATFMKQWPGGNVSIQVTSPKIKFRDYPTEEVPMEQVINIMVGDLQRVKEYPEKGFQIVQEIPDEVWQAYEKLVELGFVEHMIS